MNLAWGVKVSPEFRGKVKQVAAAIGVQPSWLMAAMWFESKLSPTARNTQSNATGLIQFMPSTAIALGTTVDELMVMPAVQQLDYVLKYFVKNGYVGRMPTIADLYMAIFWPKGIGESGDYKLITDAASKAYIQNKGLDLNRDGNITKTEASTYVIKALAEGLQPENATLEHDEHQADTDVISTTKEPSIMGGLASLLSPIAAILFQAFGSVVQSKITKEVDRHADQPGVGQAVADSLSAALLNFASQVTGKTDPLEAVAVVRQKPEVVAEAEQVAQKTVEQRLNDLAPLLDKTIGYDRAKWEAENIGKQIVSNIAIEEKRAGLWDMTQTLVTLAGGMAAIMVLLITLAIIYQSIWGADGIDVGLIGLGGPLLMAAIQCWKDVFAYRFDGTKESSDQTKAFLKAVDQGEKK